jgi:hypothetical protein
VWCRNRGWKHVTLRSVSGKWSAAHVLPWEGLGGSAIFGVPASCTLDRHRSVWLRPPELPHPDGVLDGPLRRFMFALVAKRQARSGFGCLLSFGAGDTVRVYRRSPEATRLRSEGLHTGYDFGSSASRPLRGSADGRTGIGVIFQPHSKQQPTYRELLGASGVGATGWSVEGQPPVVLRQSWAHPSGRNRVRRSSLVSFGTHLPTSNVPTPGATDHCWRHLRVAMAAAPNTRPGRNGPMLASSSGGNGGGPEYPTGCRGHGFSLLREGEAGVRAAHQVHELEPSRSSECGGPRFAQLVWMQRERTTEGSRRITTWWTQTSRTLTGTVPSGARRPWERRGATATFPKNSSTRIGEVTPGGHLAPKGVRLLERETL